MKEKAKFNAEKSHELISSGEKHELLTAKASPEQIAAIEKKHGEKAHEARKAVSEIKTDETQRKVQEGLKAAENAPQEAVSHGFIDKQLKTVALRNEMRTVRRRLSAPQRTLSYVIHQPVVRVVSEAAGRTVSRPSGLLGGGLTAFLGSIGYYYLTSHYGFPYNHAVFLLLFAGGFILGVVLELLVFTATASRRRNQ